MRIKPGSTRPGFARIDDEWVLRVRERAIEGAANDACVRAIAAALDVPVSRVTLVRGHRSRRKIFDIAGLTEGETSVRLNVAVERGAPP